MAAGQCRACQPVPAQGDVRHRGLPNNSSLIFSLIGPDEEAFKVLEDAAFHNDALNAGDGLLKHDLKEVLEMAKKSFEAIFFRKPQ